MYPQLKGKNIAIVTHAGGPAVMLTDALSEGGLTVPHIEGKEAEELLSQLFPDHQLQTQSISWLPVLPNNSASSSITLVANLPGLTGSQ